MFKTLRLACLGTIVAVAFATAAPAADVTPIKITIGWQPTMNGARFFVAEAEKLFEKEGLDVNLIKFTAGPPFFAAFQSDSIDVGFMGLQPAVTAVAQGIPVKIVAIENDGSGAEALVARNDSGIKTLADMRGKKIATKRGSSAHTALLTGLKMAGLKLSDIQFVDLDVSALVPAFARGDIQAAWYWEPWMGLLKRQGGTVVATDAQVDCPGGILWVAREKWLQSNPEAMQRLLRVLDLAAARISEHPKEVAPEIAKRLGLTDEHVLEVLTKEATWPTNAQSLANDYVFSMDPTVVAKGKGIAGMMQDNANFQVAQKIIQQNADYVKAIDTGPIVKYAAGK